MSARDLDPRLAAGHAAAKTPFAASGLCGWLGYRPPEDDRFGAAERMAEPLARFTGHRMQPHFGAAFCVTAVGMHEARQLASEGGITAVAVGMPRFADMRWHELAQRAGQAEALRRLWIERGEAMCEAVSGEFSFCIVDEERGSLFLAVDRMGTRPLYYQAAGGALLFASSAAALVRHPAARRELDPQSLYDYLYFHMVPGPQTVWRGTERLLPGECLSFRGGNLAVRSYWKMRFDETRRASHEELKEEFLALLRDSVREASGCGRTGAFLSGGTDSSTIAGMLARQGDGPARTYSIGFDAEGYDEMAYARIAARRFGTAHHEYYVTPGDVVAAIPMLAAACDQPFGNASAVPAFYCARLAREDGVERMLGGDGGDELFGGNERYARQHVFSLYERIPGPLRAGLLEPIAYGMPGGARIPLVRKARSYIAQASTPMPARLETYNLLGRYGPSAMLCADFLGGVDTGHPLACLEESYRACGAGSLINRMLALDLKVTLADNDLPKVTRACELAGVDVAFPFLNDALVAFSARLAPDQKLRGTKLRYFFKEALRGFLPDEIITKQKHGFGLPFGVWLQRDAELRALAGDSLSDLKRRGIVRPQFIDELLGRHLQEHAGYHGTMVWVLMMLEQWLQQQESPSP